MSESFEEMSKEVADFLAASEEEEASIPISSIKDIISSKNLNLKQEDGILSTIMTLGMKKKTEDDYFPNEAQLEKINTFAKRTLKKEDVYVFELQSADTNIDRAYEQFSSKAITRMAELSINKPVLMDHEWAVGATVGKIFDAKNQAGKLVQTAYFPVKSPIVESIMNGLVDKLSVGFALEPEDFVCSACSKSMFSMDCPHMPGEKGKGGEVITATIKNVSDYFEVSLVAVPCQQDAHIRQGKELVNSKGFEASYNDIPNFTIKQIEPINEEVSTPVDTIPIGDNSDKEFNLMSDNVVNTEVKEEVLEQEVVETPAAVAEPEAEVQEVVAEESEVKQVPDVTVPEVQAVDLSPITEKVAQVEAKIEELLASLKEANEKLQVLVDQPTTALSKKLAESVSSEADAFKKKYWVMDKFELTGGQE